MTKPLGYLEVAPGGVSIYFGDTRLSLMADPDGYLINMFFVAESTAIFALVPGQAPEFRDGLSSDEQAGVIFHLRISLQAALAYGARGENIGQVSEQVMELLRLGTRTLADYFGPSLLG